MCYSSSRQSSSTNSPFVYIHVHCLMFLVTTPSTLVLSPDPTQEEIRLIPQASLTLITFWREISLHQSDCRKHSLWLQHRKFLALGYFSTFLVRKISYHSQLQAMNMKPKESARYHQTTPYGCLATGLHHPELDSVAPLFLLMFLFFRLHCFYLTAIAVESTYCKLKKFQH